MRRPQNAAIRVVHFYPYFTTGGGVANAVCGLASAQAEAGASVTIVSFAHRQTLYGLLSPDGVTVVECASRASAGLGGVRLHAIGPRTARSLRDLRPDVVHMHGGFNPDDWWVPRLWRCPIVLSPHGSFHEIARRRREKRRAAYIRLGRVLLYREVSAFHALGAVEVPDIEAVWPAARTYCVPQGPSPAVRAPGSAGHRRTAGDPVVLLFMGRLDVYMKGLDILLEGLALAVRRRKLARPCVLRLVGPDWRGGRSELERLAHRLGIADQVRLEGRVPLAEVPARLLDCDVYVQVSRHEGSPLSLNDALVLGKPAIVSDRISTISHDEIARLEHVRVVQPTAEATADAIVETVRNLDSLASAAEAARPNLTAFLSWDRAAMLHLREYERLAVA